MIIWTLIIILLRISQSTLINDYIVKAKFTNYQSITDAVAQLKKNDLQEIFRELQIAGGILELVLKNPSYISSSYITSAKSNKLISSSDSAKYLSSPDPTKMSYYVEFGEMNYSILSTYSPAGQYFS